MKILFIMLLAPSFAIAEIISLKEGILHKYTDKNFTLVMDGENRTYPLKYLDLTTQRDLSKLLGKKVNFYSTVDYFKPRK